MIASERFYADLPALASFEAAIDVAGHVDLPDDWWLIVADVANSTEAIAQGAYKQVNTVGVACIAAIVNLDRSLPLPFVFGGDGASLAIPPRLHEPARVALRGARRMAREVFGLDLRAGLLAVADCRARGLGVRLAKVALSPSVSLPVFSGDGWAEAERAIKGEIAEAACHLIAEDGPSEASFSGFECRWQNVPSRLGHKLTLIVQATAADPAAHPAIYRELLRQIDLIFGAPGEQHPLHASGLKLGFSPRALQAEIGVHAGQRGRLARWRTLAGLWLRNLAGRWLFARGIDTAAVRWSRYRDDLVSNSDVRKFDGALRMVLDASDTKSARLEAWLAAARARGELVYGTHRSQAALITCLVESYEGRHLHFIDGSDGGYALASRALKMQLAPT